MDQHRVRQGRSLTLYYSLSSWICKACCILTTSQLKFCWSQSGSRARVAERVLWFEFTGWKQCINMVNVSQTECWIVYFLSEKIYCFCETLCNLFLLALWKGIKVTCLHNSVAASVTYWMLTEIDFLSKCCGAQFAQTNYSGIQNGSEVKSGAISRPSPSMNVVYESRLELKLLRATGFQTTHRDWLDVSISYSYFCQFWCKQM